MQQNIANTYKKITTIHYTFEDIIFGYYTLVVGYHTFEDNDD